MAERRKHTEADQKALEIKKAFDHVTLSDPMVFGMYAVPSDGGKSAKLLEENGFTTEDIWAYFRMKVSGISYEQQGVEKVMLRKHLRLGING